MWLHKYVGLLVNIKISRESTRSVNNNSKTQFVTPTIITIIIIPMHVFSRWLSTQRNE